MPYAPVEDIPNLEKLKVDIRKLTPLMHEVIATTRLALNHRYNYRRRFDYDDELQNFLKNQLLIYSTTHNSLHILLKHVVSKEDYPPTVDAASLVREQIEKVFQIALVLSNPKKWIKQYLRGNWRTDYETYLLALEEHGENPRFKKFLEKDYVDHLKGGQRPPTRSSTRASEIIVSEFSKRALTHYWKNPAGKNPPWFKRRGSLRNYVNDYFEFPTPGKSVKFIEGKSRRRFLFRWHKEYSYFSQYTHNALGKAVIPFVSEYKHIEAVEKVKIASQILMERTIFTSFTAAASSCALIVTQLRDSYGAKSYLKEFWVQLYESSLISKAFWNIYPKKILK